jgi:DNA-directed RNA polymerase alpha subunit
MTKKDYIQTANILNSVADEIDFITLANVAEQFAEMFAKDNQNFDHAKFIDAVMKESN